MSTVTQAMKEELASDEALKKAIAKALDFSEAYAAIESAEKKIEELKKKTVKEPSQ